MVLGVAEAKLAAALATIPATGKWSVRHASVPKAGLFQKPAQELTGLFGRQLGFILRRLVRHQRRPQRYSLNYQ